MAIGFQWPRWVSTMAMDLGFGGCGGYMFWWPWALTHIYVVFLANPDLALMSVGFVVFVNDLLVWVWD